MKNLFRAALFSGLLLVSGSLATAGGSVQSIPEPRAPRVEVCFVLDTTGSMKALIEGAKQKIWAIANQIASAQQRPQVRIGLIGYRDRQDAYVTKAFDLTGDLDAIYGHLIGFDAQGGGDQPESVNQALFEAVTKMPWSRDRETLKLVFLVGDAPPHMDYPDDIPYTETVKLAAAADITINTIQTGNIAQTTPFWQEIASRSDGQFVRIDQSGGMRAVSTPMDSELMQLNAQLGETVVAYGNDRQRADVDNKNNNAMGRGARGGSANSASPPPAAALADRLSVFSAESAVAGARTVISGDGELIRDIANGKVKIEDVKESDLPPNMQKMTPYERKSFVATQLERRKALQTQVDALTRKRTEYLKEEMSKSAEAPDSFDAKVSDIVRTQGQKKGIVYESVTPGK